MACRTNLIASRAISCCRSRCSWVTSVSSLCLQQLRPFLGRSLLERVRSRRRELAQIAELRLVVGEPFVNLDCGSGVGDRCGINRASGATKASLLRLARRSRAALAAGFLFISAFYHSAIDLQYMNTSGRKASPRGSEEEAMAAHSPAAREIALRILLIEDDPMDAGGSQS